MANERDVLGIVLQSSSEGTGFDTVQRDISDTERQGQDAAKNLETSYQESFTAIRNASALAFAAVGAGIAFAVREAAAGEQGMAEFASSVRNAGGDADELRERLNATAINLQRLTGIANGEFVSAAARMTDITGDAAGSIDRLNVVADLAVARKINMASAADMVARATSGEIGMLAQILPGLDEQVLALGENADKAEVAAVIFDRLAQFQGRAAEAAGTTSGRFKIMQQEIAATTENIGNAFLPMTNTLTGKLTDIARGLGEWAGEHETLVGIIGGGALTLSGAAATITTIGLAAPVAARGLATLRTASLALAASPWTVIAAGVVAVAGVTYQLHDAMTATGDSEAELNDIIEETGVSYTTLRNKQEEIFGKFSDYKTGTDQQREAWDSYIAALRAGMPTLEEVTVTLDKASAGRIATPPVAGFTQTVTREFDTSGIDSSIEKLGNEQSVENHQIMLDEKAAADEQARKERLALYEAERQSFLYHTGWIQDTYRAAVGTFADTEMTGKQRREQIWGQFRTSVASYIADVTAKYIFGELAKRSATLATATVGVAASQTAAAAEVASANTVTASWMAAAYAKLVAFYAFSGPLAPVLAVGTIGAAIAGVGAIIASAMGALKFQDGGIVPGSGSGDKVPALLEPGERVINRNDYAANRGAIESAIRGGASGGGGHFHFHLDRDTAADDALRLRQLFETWVVPVIEQKQREGAFTRVGIPQ